MSRLSPFLVLALSGCVTDTPTPGLDTATSSPQTNDDGSCAPPSQGVAYSRLFPNLMLAIDRSGSMIDKWDQVLALGDLLDQVGSMSTLGLALFPSGLLNACGTASSIVVPLGHGSDTAGDILDALLDTRPGGSTPIAGTLDNIRLQGGLDDPSRDNVVVLLSDGVPNCACEDNDPVCEREEAVAAVQLLVGQPVPIELFVIGFGTDDEANETLAAIAGAAEPTTGPDNFYTASTTEELVGRLAAVAGSLAACRFSLDESISPEDLVVSLDDDMLLPCTEDRCERGYIYNAALGIVDIEGSDCLTMQDDTCHDLWFDRK